MKTRSSSRRRIADVYGAPDKPIVAHTKLELSSDLGELVRVRDFVRHVCQELDGQVLDEIATSEVQLAATEAASNIMRHAYAGQPDRKIELSGQVRDDRVCIELSHEGEHYSAPEVDEPDVDATTRGGLGLFIMQEFLDEILHTEEQESRQTTTLIKNRHPRTMTES